MKTIKRYGFTIVTLLILLVLACVLVFPFVNTVHAVPRGNTRETIGNYTGPITGAAQDDNIKASLDLAHTDLDAVLADTSALDTSAEFQVIAEGGLRCAEVTISSIATATNLFQVTGGPIIIRDIVGVVTTTIVATGCLINYNIDPIAPATDTVFGTDGTALEINNDAIGAVYTWDGVIATDLTATDNGVVLTQGTDVANGLLCPIGMIELAATATNAGVIKFYIVYSPLSPLSVVTPQ